jgi:hypothetical protein
LTFVDLSIFGFSLGSHSILSPASPFFKSKLDAISL